MAEAQPLEQRPVRCQHCYDMIVKQPGENDWWRDVQRQSVICDSTIIDVKHKPMPAIA